MATPTTDQVTGIDNAAVPAGRAIAAAASDDGIGL